jgi:hypothetical protein
LIQPFKAAVPQRAKAIIARAWQSNLITQGLIYVKQYIQVAHLCGHAGHCFILSIVDWVRLGAKELLLILLLLVVLVVLVVLVLVLLSLLFLKQQLLSLLLQQLLSMHLILWRYIRVFACLHVCPSIQARSVGMPTCSRVQRPA